MRTHPRSGRRGGITLVEVVLSVVLGCTVLGAGLATIAMSNDVARTSATDDAASRCVSRVLRLVADDVRRASRGTLQHLDGTAFEDGDSATGVTFQHVVGYRGTTLLGALVEIRHDATTGDVIRTEGGVSETLVRSVGSFQVAREGNRVVVSVSAHRGPTDDRGRAALGSAAVHVRNP